MKIYLIILVLLFSEITSAQPIPLPEHPRPDFERPNWINLNGSWDFEFDSLYIGLEKTDKNKDQLLIRTRTICWVHLFMIKSEREEMYRDQ